MSRGIEGVSISCVDEVNKYQRLQKNDQKNIVHPKRLDLLTMRISHQRMKIVKSVIPEKQRETMFHEGVISLLTQHTRGWTIQIM